MVHTNIFRSIALARQFHFFKTENDGFDTNSKMTTFLDTLFIPIFELSKDHFPVLVNSIVFTNIYLFALIFLFKLSVLFYFLRG